MLDGDNMSQYVARTICSALMDGVAFFLICDGATNLSQLHVLVQELKKNEITPLPRKRRTRCWLLEKAKQAF